MMISIVPTLGFFRSAHTRENYKSTYAIVFLAVNPDPRMYEFAQKIASESYHVYFAIDSQTYVAPKDTPFVKTLQIPRAEAKQKGYSDCMLWVPDDACALCQSLYYFCEKNTVSYDAFWFIEEDVLIPSVNTLRNLDQVYPLSIDLLCNAYNQAETDNGEWQFPRNRGRIDLTWAGGARQAVRVSPKMIHEVKQFASRNTRLLMDELLFHTLALHAGLNINVAPELQGMVVYRNWDETQVKETHMYHPAKVYQEHLDIASRKGFEHFSPLLSRF